VLRARVTEKVDATIAELRTWMTLEHGVSVSHAVMRETLGRLGLTLKKAHPCGRTAVPFIDIISMLVTPSQRRAGGSECALWQDHRHR
jgi:hypothetical protein